MRFWLLIALTFSNLCISCGNQATIVLRNGTTIEAQIVEKRDAMIVAENDESERVEVPERQVSEIRHPGSTAMVVGGVLLATGVIIFTAAAIDNCSDEKEQASDVGNDAALCEGFRKIGMAIGASLGATGLGVGVWGFGVKEESKARARKRSDERALEEPRDDVRGLSVVRRF